MPLYKVFIGVGSNIDKEKNIVSGIQAMQKQFGALELSPVYESRAVGFEGNNFYNMVATFNTAYTYQQIRDILYNIEHQHRRIRGKNKFESRTLDLDQIMYGNLIINEDDIRLPADEIEKHAFISYPLSDLCGDLIHPVLGKKVSELCELCEDQDVLLRKLKFSDLVD